jgi:CubicO group peptidase (beta-lactamase class C family)
MFQRLLPSMTSSALVSLCLFACSDSESGNPGESSSWPTGDWSIEPPEARGMDGSLLDRAREYAFQDGRNTQGVVVTRGGVIVAEWYADGSDAASWAASWSVAKSFTSALVGIAIDEGLIDGVDVPMSRFLPAWAGTGKEQIRLRDVLQMASGLEWNENYDPASAGSSDVIQLVFQGGRELEYAAAKPVAEPPGAVFNYSSGSTMLLSAVIQEATGLTAAEYAREKLFSPLGIARADWWRSMDGHTLTFCCVDMASRDFARLGLLYARGGRWARGRLISANWVADSVRPSTANPGYGYQWWLLGVSDRSGPPNQNEPTSTLPPDTFAAMGVDGQFIYVVPRLDLVVVRNGRYVKDPGDPVADPTLFAHYPPFGLNPDLGTASPSSWSHAEFLQLVLDAVSL